MTADEHRRRGVTNLLQTMAWIHGCGQHPSRAACARCVARAEEIYDDLHVRGPIPA